MGRQRRTESSRKSVADSKLTKSNTKSQGEGEIRSTYAHRRWPTDVCADRLLAPDNLPPRPTSRNSRRVRGLSPLPPRGRCIISPAHWRLLKSKRQKFLLPQAQHRRLKPNPRPSRSRGPSPKNGTNLRHRTRATAPPSIRPFPKSRTPSSHERTSTSI